MACDVTNPLTGEEGASAVLARKRGDAGDDYPPDRALTHYAQLIARDLDVNVLDLAGGGAAGGMGRRYMRFAAHSCAAVLR